MAEEAGMIFESVLDAEDLKPPKTSSERLMVILREKGKERIE